MSPKEVEDPSNPWLKYWTFPEILKFMLDCCAKIIQTWLDITDANHVEATSDDDGDSHQFSSRKDILYFRCQLNTETVDKSYQA